MPWLIPYDEERYNEIVGGNRVPSWPHPNSSRVDARYRMGIGEGLPFPRPSRFLFRLTPYLPAPTVLWGWVDLSVNTTDHFVADTGLDALGRKVTFELIQNYDPFLPLTDINQWLDFKWTYSRVGFDDVWFNWRYHTSIANQGPVPVMAALQEVVDVSYVYTTNLPFVINTDWTSPNGRLAWNWDPMSECYDLIPPPPAEEFANFNGVDAELLLDSLTGNWGTTWQWSGDFYFRSLTNAHITILSAGSAVISGVSPTQGYARDKTVNHGGSVPLNEWVNIRLERNWSEPATGKLKIWVNGVEKGQNITTQPNMNMDVIGAPRPTAIPTFADLNMKNFKLETGTAATPLVRLNMPLQLNACDAGPLGNDGTTVNMSLPSCP